MRGHSIRQRPPDSAVPLVGPQYQDMAAGLLRRYFVAPDVRAAIPRLLLGGSHRLHRNGISVGCARDFGLLPSQLAEVVQRGLIRGVKGIDFVADYQSVLCYPDMSACFGLWGLIWPRSFLMRTRSTGSCRPAR